MNRHFVSYVADFIWSVVLGVVVAMVFARSREDFCLYFAVSFGFFMIASAIIEAEGGDVR